MNQTFDLIIRSPEEEEFIGKAVSVSFTSEGGDLQIFADHASITNTIVYSPVYIETADGGPDVIFFVRRGFFQFDNEKNTATLLALFCVKEGEVSLQTVREYRAFLEERLQEGGTLSDFQVLYLQGEHLAVLEQIKYREERNMN